MSSAAAEGRGDGSPKGDLFHRDFATVCAGYLVGHGVLRLSASALLGLGDAPRADLLLRWLPTWNALGWFLAAWGVHQTMRWVNRRSAARGTTSPPTLMFSPAAIPQLSPVRENKDSSFTPPSTTRAPPDWKERLKGFQRRKDIDAILDFQQELAKLLPHGRAEQLDRRLGRWFTKHFQHVMLSGRAAESLADVERVAAHYANLDEFAYFQGILPVVRQCAELKQSLKDEE